MSFFFVDKSSAFKEFMGEVKKNIYINTNIYYGKLNVVSVAISRNKKFTDAVKEVFMGYL